MSRLLGRIPKLHLMVTIDFKAFIASFFLFFFFSFI